MASISRAGPRSERRRPSVALPSTTPTQPYNLSSMFESPSPTRSPRKKRHSRTSSSSTSAGPATRTSSSSSKAGQHERTRSWISNAFRPRTLDAIPPPPTPYNPAASLTKTSPPRSVRERSGSISATLKKWRKPRPSAFGGPLIPAFNQEEQDEPRMESPYPVSFPTPYDRIDPSRKFRSGEALAEWNRELSQVDTTLWKAEPAVVLASSPPSASPPRGARRASYHAPASPSLFEGGGLIARASPAVPRSEAATLSLVSVWDDFVTDADLSLEEGNASSVLSASPFAPTWTSLSARGGWSTEGAPPTFPLAATTTTPPRNLASSTYSDALALSPFPSPPLISDDPDRFAPPTIPFSLSPPSSLAQRRARAVPALILSTSPESFACRRDSTATTAEEIEADADLSYFSPESSSDDDELDFSDVDLDPTPRRPTPTTMLLQGLAIAPESFDANPTYNRRSVLARNNLLGSPLPPPSFASSSSRNDDSPRSAFSPYSTPFLSSPASLSSSTSSSTFSSPYEASHTSFETLASSIEETSAKSSTVSVAIVEPLNDWSEARKALSLAPERSYEGVVARARMGMEGAAKRRREAHVVGGGEDGQVMFGLAL